jgi:hypothetical protein
MILGIIIEQGGKLSVPSEIYHIPSRQQTPGGWKGSEENWGIRKFVVIEILVVVKKETNLLLS